MSLNAFFIDANVSVFKVLSYDGVHPPDSLAVTAAGIAVYVR